MFSNKQTKSLLELGVLDHNDLRAMWLDSLEAAGVDNWGGIDEAIKIMKDWVNSEAEEANIVL
jgi:hypothetical protein